MLHIIMHETDDYIFSTDYEVRSSIVGAYAAYAVSQGEEMRIVYGGNFDVTLVSEIEDRIKEFEINISDGATVLCLVEDDAFMFEIEPNGEIKMLVDGNYLFDKIVVASRKLIRDEEFINAVNIYTAASDSKYFGPRVATLIAEYLKDHLLELDMKKIEIAKC